MFGDIVNPPETYCLKQADEYTIDLADDDYLDCGYTNFIEKTGLILSEDGVDDRTYKRYSSTNDNMMKLISSFYYPDRWVEITCPFLYVAVDSSNVIQEVRIVYDSFFNSNISYKGING